MAWVGNGSQIRMGRRVNGMFMTKREDTMDIKIKCEAMGEKVDGKLLLM